MKVTNHIHVVYRRIRRWTRGPAWDFHDLTDWRQPRKVRCLLSSVVFVLGMGLLRNDATLRDVERRVRNPKPVKEPARPCPDSFSDTTLARIAQHLKPEELHMHLVLQVRALQRDKMLAPEDLPCGVATVDGKNLGTLKHDVPGWAHPENDTGGRTYWLCPVLRATLTSAATKPCIGQMVIPSGKGEASTFAEFVDQLHAAYGRSSLFEVVDVDAGLTGLANLNHVNQLGYAYFAGLKDNQPDLLTEAQRVLHAQVMASPAVETPWELRGGYWMRRRLWRTEELAGWQTTAGRWTHLRQVVLVRQEAIRAQHPAARTRPGQDHRPRKRPRLPLPSEIAALAQYEPVLSRGRKERQERRSGTKGRRRVVPVEERFFVTSLLWKRFSPVQLLHLVRNHWGVENDTFNSLDLQWREDQTPWCTTGQAIWSLGILRLMAYNVAQCLRKRTLRIRLPNHSRGPLLRWRELFSTLRAAVALLLNPALQQKVLGTTG